MLPDETEHPQSDATISANPGIKHDPCGTKSPLGQSVEFPPPPSKEELVPVNNEVSMRELSLWFSTLEYNPVISLLSSRFESVKVSQKQLFCK